MTYPEALRYLESFIDYEKISSWRYKEALKLERFRDFLSAIGDPQQVLKCVHVAGSKGKGSTCAFTAYILRADGYKVGLYTSPHLCDFRERIRILKPHPASRNPLPDFEGMISRPDMARLISRLKPGIDKFCKSSRYGALSFFEIYTALAFVYFKEKKVDFAVLETGLGGRLDATNSVKAHVCAITPISLEHTHLLGSTIRKIAREKAGIIKSTRAQEHKSTNRHLIVISAPQEQEQEARKVIVRRCKDTGARLYEIGKDIIYRKDKTGFLVRGIHGDYAGLKISLRGEHQLVNAAVAVGMVEALKSSGGLRLSQNAVRSGLRDARWPGRCEMVAENPYVVLDGAQNPASAKVLKETIKSEFNYQKLILILGVSGDKDIKGICAELLPLADTLILTRSRNPRAASLEILDEVISRAGMGYNNPVIRTRTVAQAKAMALNLARKRDLVLVTGSLFVVGEFRNDKA